MPLGLGFTRFGPALGSASSDLVRAHMMACQLKGVIFVYWPLVEIIISCVCIFTGPKSIVQTQFQAISKLYFIQNNAYKPL